MSSRPSLTIGKLAKLLQIVDKPETAEDLEWGTHRIDPKDIGDITKYRHPFSNLPNRQAAAVRRLVRDPGFDFFGKWCLQRSQFHREASARFANELIHELAIKHDRSIRDISRLQPAEACALWDETAEWRRIPLPAPIEQSARETTPLNSLNSPAGTIEGKQGSTAPAVQPALDTPPPTLTPEIDYDKLADHIGGIYGQLIRLMKNKSGASHQEILDFVYNKEEREWGTIKSLAYRTNEKILEAIRKLKLKGPRLHFKPDLKSYRVTKLVAGVSSLKPR